jgi:hypothetical protein
MDANERKSAIYEAMASLNRSFEQIIGTMGRLEKVGIVTSDYVQDQEIIASELWAKINCHILLGITQNETDDREHFGKMRATLEKRIRGRQ